jgi:alpha-L-fucosidase 2
LRYAAELIGRGDKATPAKSNDDRLEISGATLTFILLAGTDYQMDPAKGFRSGQDPAKKLLLQQVDLALADSVDNKLYDSLRDRHRADFSGLMNRIVLDLGSPPSGKTLTERLAAYHNGKEDPHLEMLLFQFGRYLMVSSSRTSLPANLQG